MLRCYVTDRKRADVVTCVRRVVHAGIDLIQVRETDLPSRDLLDLVAEILEITRDTSTRVLVNDRLDVALAAGADGVHLPEAGLPAGAVRELIGLVGASTHSVEKAQEAEADGVDFIFFGPVFETPGKSPVGVARLREVTRSVRVPVLAIGGINASNTDDVEKAGAAGFAAIRMFQDG